MNVNVKPPCAEQFLPMSSAQREAVGRAMRPLEQPHEILGVPRNADEPTLRKSFRMMCKLLHPDKCHLQEAKTAFQRVGAAFEALLAKAQAGGADYAATTATTTTMTAPAQAAPAPATKAPKLSKGELNFTVRVAQAPSAVRNPARPPTRPPPSKPKPSASSTVQQMDLAPPEDDEEDEDDSSSEEDDDEEDVSFAISARAGFADDDLGSDDDLIEHPDGVPPPAKKQAAGRKRSSGKGGNAAGGSRKVGARKRRAHDDEFDDFIDDEEEEETRAEDAGAGYHGEGSRRSGRNSKRRRVDYSVIEEYGVRAERQLRGAGPDEDSDADGGSGAAAAADAAPDEAEHAWVPPLWFEYQSDSEDDEEEAERKRRLKARVLAAKRQAAQQVTRAVDGSDASQGSKVQAEASSKALSRPETDGKAATAAAAQEEFTACFCGSNHEPEWWAQCSECERWCHGECTGHSQATIEQITYLCKPCAAADAAALGAFDDDEDVGGPAPPPPAVAAAAASTGAATDDGDDDLLDLLGD